MGSQKEVNIELVKGALNDYVIKDKDEIVVGRFTIGELDKENKRMDIYMCDSLEETIKIARKSAQKGEVVLFSPASASFDMFKNFADRGNKFKN